MSEFPALRDALVGAAMRRRRRRRLATAAVPAFAACAVAVAIALTSLSPDAREREREQAAPPVKGTLEQAFGVFRRAQRPSDKLPSLRVVPGTVDRARTRLLGQIGPMRVFAVPTRKGGVPSLCLVTVGGGASTAGCGPVSDAVKEDKPPGTSIGTVSVLMVRDDTTDVRFILADGSHGSVEARDNVMLLRGQAPIAGESWTGASGTRYVRRRSPPPMRLRLPKACPPRLDPLPKDAVARARRAALIAVDQLYPGIGEATAKRPDQNGEKLRGTPCDHLLERSVLIELELLPRDAKLRRGFGQVLVGMVDGSMRVYHQLR